MNALRALASLRLTVLALIALGACILAGQIAGGAGARWIGAPLALLAANLAAALATNVRLRAHPGLALFHLGLLAVVLLAWADRATHLRGRVELAEGQAFEPAALEIVSAGRWHPRSRLADVRFVQGAFGVEYWPGFVRGVTDARVWVPRGGGHAPRRVADDAPLALAGYRFRVTPNKGYAPLLTWIGADGATATGTVHLPSYPRYDWKQHTQWIAPSGTALTVALARPQPAPARSRWRLDSTAADGPIAIGIDGARHELRVGDAVAVPGGQVRYDGLRMWIGYDVEYGPLLGWLLVAACVAIAGLAAYLWRLPVARAPQPAAGNVPEGGTPGR